jgi:hypothetical protein
MFLFRVSSSDSVVAVVIFSASGDGPVAAVAGVAGFASAAGATQAVVAHVNVSDESEGPAAP